LLSPVPRRSSWLPPISSIAPHTVRRLCKTRTCKGACLTHAHRPNTYNRLRACWTISKGRNNLVDAPSDKLTSVRVVAAVLGLAVGPAVDVRRGGQIESGKRVTERPGVRMPPRHDTSPSIQSAFVARPCSHAPQAHTSHGSRGQRRSVEARPWGGSLKHTSSLVCSISTSPSLSSQEMRHTSATTRA
jgi:hypothetical protein